MGHRDHKSSHKKLSSSDRSHARDEKYRHKESSKDVKKGIEETKNRLNASLSNAISELSAQKSSSQAYSSIDILESVNRQEQIEKINDESGFKPSSFFSSNSLRQNNSKDQQKDHDKAMFGASWMGKELEKKQISIKNTVEIQPTIKVGDILINEQQISRSSFPLAHEKLSADPEVRQKRWLSLFLQRRKQVLDGTL